VVNSKSVNGRVQVIVSAALLLAGLGGGAQTKAFPADDKQVADTQASQAQPTNGSAVAVPPKITYEGGQLTIIAENSMLSDVMNTLHTVLGADVDLPASASTERVWAHLGPGPARKILSDLLSGTDLNFVIQGSATDPAGIRSVLLTPHTDSNSTGPGNANALEAPERAGIRRFPASRREAMEPPQEDNPAPAPTETPVTPAAAPAADAAPTTTPAGTPAATAAAPGAASSAASLSTPSEIVPHPNPPSSMTQENVSQQLLSMYQQRRQLTQQGVPVPPINTAPPQ
jgi:hypothetical protein